MLEKAKTEMRGVTAEASGQDQVHAAMKALALVTNVLKAREGEEGVMVALQRARARADQEQKLKEKLSALKASR